jgi:hypothetical protein
MSLLRRAATDRPRIPELLMTDKTVTAVPASSRMA